MDLKKLATKPQLIRVELNDEDIVKEYGEALEFYVWDKQPLTKFIHFANAEAANFGDLVSFCTELILDSEGQPVMSGDNILPAGILVKCVNRVVEQLGK